MEESVLPALLLNHKYYDSACRTTARPYFGHSRSFVLNLISPYYNSHLFRPPWYLQVSITSTQHHCPMDTDTGPKSKDPINHLVYKVIREPSKTSQAEKRTSISMYTVSQHITGLCHPHLSTIFKQSAASIIPRWNVCSAQNYQATSRRSWFSIAH